MKFLCQHARRGTLIKTLIHRVKLIFSYSSRVAKDIAPEICAEIVRLLTEERKRQGLSQNALAAKAGVNQSMVSALEKNPWNPTIGSLLRIADGLGIDLGEIVTVARKIVLKKSRKA